MGALSSHTHVHVCARPWPGWGDSGFYISGQWALEVGAFSIVLRVLQHLFTRQVF